MNDRMWELEEQCWEPKKYGPEWFNSKKFAELIIGECMQVARGADGLDATHEAWYLIKEHFGVEE